MNISILFTTTTSSKPSSLPNQPVLPSSLYRSAARMALPSTSIPRFDLSSSQRVAGGFHGNVTPVLIGSIRRGKLHRTARRSSICCMHNVTIPCSIQSALLAASVTPYDPSRTIQPSVSTIHPSLYAALSECLQGFMIGDIDPATAKLAITFTGPFLSAFGFLFILRIVMSWYPKLPVTKFPYVIAYAPTEPFLQVTRKVIPPLGGVDVTPVVWFGLVSFLNEILVGPQGLLVVLSQQV